MINREGIETIPTDSLVVARKVMTDSASVLGNSLTAVVAATALNQQTTLSRPPRLSIGLLAQDEFAEKKLEHPSLAIWSVVRLVDGFKAETQEQRDGITDFVYGVGLVGADSEQIDDGHFLIGLLLDREFEKRAVGERTRSIDTLLDLADISPEDPVRSWRTDVHESSWLPVLRVRSTDPAVEQIVDDLSGSLEEAVKPLEIDLFDAKAHPVIVNVPAPQ